ncbi:MAG: ATP-binding cassette domain-containing protein, partial [Planctomycetota bacterium]
LSCRALTRRPFFEGRDLVLEAGEILVLHGASGSGKTLFLRALADLDPADSGELRLSGESREALRPEVWRARVLYVHQGGVRLPGTVRENLDRIASLAIRADGGAVSFPSVPGLDDTQDAGRLSGGEAQALALHRALLCAPKVLLLDEATSALDPERAAFWEGRVRRFAADGHGVVWVAHDVRLADRVGARRERFP